MKTKQNLYVVVMVISTLFFMSCDRYKTKTSLKENDIPQNVAWKRMVTDSIKADIIRYFIIMGEKRRPVVSDMLVHKRFGILHIPDSLIKKTPSYYDCFYLGEKMIFEREVCRTSGPTLWKSPQVTFNLKVMDPVSFDQATVIIVTRDARIVWQVVLILFFVVFGLFSFFLLICDYDTEWDREWGLKWGRILLVFTIGMLLWTSFYVSYFVSGLCTLLFFTFVVVKIRERRKAKKVKID